MEEEETCEECEELLDDCTCQDLCDDCGESTDDCVCEEEVE